MRRIIFATTAALWFTVFNSAFSQVELKSDSLWVDGVKQPFLFGAEVQYFRARGGARRNVPADQVEKLWEKLLDRVEEAGMNAVILYIPWDFHEPVEGVFDFDGTLDRDRDGKPDYPSRNIKKFLKMISDRGIKNVMVRPGPYINAEWGHEGFGAIPTWFLDGYPQALTVNQHANRARTIAFSHPDLQMRAERWFKALYENVLKEFIGAGKPIAFVQIDNETNYFWDSVYERDRSDRSKARFHDFLRTIYHGNISELNTAYGSTLSTFSEIQIPNDKWDLTYPKGAWHYDWYHFHDYEILEYYKFLRATWEKLGVREPDVLFTSCDSFNSSGDGLLPRLDYRGKEGLSLTTLNIYPKTWGPSSVSTLNNPMKGAHDAHLFSSAHRQYYGTGGDWLMSTETMGGWFPPTEVNLAARQHTYGALLGSGVKAMMIYYFHEGWNWNSKEEEDSELHFDAPLDKDMNPRPAYFLLKQLGDALKAEMAEKLMGSHFESSAVLIAHESSAQYPNSPQADTQEKTSTESAALFGLLREAGNLPDVAFLDTMSLGELRKYKIVFWEHAGPLTPASKKLLQDYLGEGGTVVTIGNTGLKKKKRENLIVWKTSPAKGWNSDQYLTMNVEDPIRLVQKTLIEAGVSPSVQVQAEDGQHHVHVWKRPTADGYLVFVENFLPLERKLSVVIPSLSESGNFVLKPLWGARAPQQQVEKRGIALGVDGDSVSVWFAERIQK